MKKDELKKELGKNERKLKRTEKELVETKNELEKTKTALKKSKVALKNEKEKSLNWKDIGYDILACLWVVFAIFASSYIVSYPMLWILGKTNYDSTIWITIRSMLIYIVTAIIVIFVPKLIKKEWKTDKKELGLTDLPTYLDIGLSVLGFVATILVSSVVLKIVESFGIVDPSQAQDVGYSMLTTGFDRAIAFIALVVITPIAEEIIFRGWLYGKIRKKGSLVYAIILTSLTFGMLHWQWNVGITVGIMSAVMCIEREFTETIHAGILTHMLKNGIAFALLIISGAL